LPPYPRFLGCTTVWRPSCRATAIVASWLASSTTMTSSVTVRSISSTVWASVLSALYAGMTTHTCFPLIIGRVLGFGAPL
jgi:hypothetical protein